MKNIIKRRCFFCTRWREDHRGIIFCSHYMKNLWKIDEKLKLDCRFFQEKEKHLPTDIGPDIKKPHMKQKAKGIFHEEIDEKGI